MALVVNGNQASRMPGRTLGAASYVVTNRSIWNKPGNENGHANGEACLDGTANKAGEPSGYLPPVGWVMPIKPGDLSSRFAIVSTVALAGSVNEGRQIDAAITSSTAIEGAVQLIVAIAAALTSTVANAGTMTGVATATAALTSATTVTGALAGLGNLVAALTTADAIAGTPSATGAMTADITSFSELSPENLAIAVWNALIANFQAAGSTGAALSAAGSAGDPWITALPGAYAAGSAGEIIGTKLLELYQLAGLDPTKPLVVTETTRKVPADGSDISQTIGESSGTVTVTRT